MDYIFVRTPKKLILVAFSTFLTPWDFFLKTELRHLSYFMTGTSCK